MSPLDSLGSNLRPGDHLALFPPLHLYLLMPLWNRSLPMTSSHVSPSMSRRHKTTSLPPKSDRHTMRINIVHLNRSTPSVTSSCSPRKIVDAITNAKAKPVSQNSCLLRQKR